MSVKEARLMHTRHDNVVMNAFVPSLESSEWCGAIRCLRCVSALMGDGLRVEDLTKQCECGTIVRVARCWIIPMG